MSKTQSSDEVCTLKEWRLRRYWSYRKLAQVASVSTETLLRAERGGRVHETTARKLADALGVRTQQITEFVPIAEPQ
jgi:transcriptional regulator with XRE-family HTH domain